MDFLFEIGVEELPARYVTKTANDFKNLVEKELTSERISYDNTHVYSTPRRIAILINNITDKQNDVDRTVLGPSEQIAYKDGKLTKAGEGFVKSQGARKEDVSIIENEKSKYIQIKQFIMGKETKKILPVIIDKSIRELQFDKSMKWSDKQFRFARPIKYLLSLLDDKVLDFEFEGLKASNKTRGMRFFGSQDIEINQISEYEKLLEKNFVIADYDKRKSMVLDSIKKNCETENEKVIINDYLLNEVVNLVEYPYAIKGEFNKSYLELPEDIITITMETHQRYFPVKATDGALTNKFVVIRNAPEYSELVKQGNEKVIEPRLSDAKFFFDEDLKVSLDQNVEKLKSVLFQKDMGTIYNKIERMKKISKYLIDTFNLQTKEKNIMRTIHLSKADLVSNVISEKEFTKLQGFMGSIYAEKSGEDKEVAKGIFEHYLPRYNDDILPTTMEGAITGIADKIDTLVGCFSVGLKPTSSKDPYALRRATQGIILTALEMNLNLDYKDLIEKTFTIFNENKNTEESILKDIILFFKQRVENVFSQKYSKDLLNYEVDIENKIVTLKEKLNFLNEFSKTENFDVLINLIKRIKNILEGYNFNKNKLLINKNLFLLKEEKKLFLFIEEYKNINNFEESIKILCNHASIINDFFDNVMVNDENIEIKNNRYNLLLKLSIIVEKVLKVS